METQIHHDELLSAGWPTVTLIVLAVLSVVIWAASHWVSKRTIAHRGILWLPLFVARCALGVVALWLVCNAMSRVIVLATSWSIVGVCVFCAVAVEIILAFYYFERKFVSPRLGATLTTLRVALVLVLGLLLLQPVFAWTLERLHERYIAVLLDDSQSMQISDQQLTDSEKLRLIRVFDPTIAKPPYDLSSAVAELSPLADRLSAASDALTQLSAVGDEKTQKEFSLRRKSIEQAIRTSQDIAGKQAERIHDLLLTEVQLKDETRDSAQRQQKRLNSEIVARLVEADQLIEQNSQNIKPHFRTLIAHLNGSASAVRDVILALPALIDDADRSYFSSLPPEKIEKANGIMAQTRSDIARTLLLGDENEVQSLISKIKEGYKVRIFRFNQQCSELSLERLEQEDATPAITQVAYREPVSAEQSETPNDNSQQSVTDFAVALETVRKEIPSENLAGILLVTDGRHNGTDEVEPIVRQLGSQEIPVSALVIGSSRPPVDAAILDVEYPNTVLVDDLLSVKARLKLTGMRGRSVRAKLMDGEETLQEKILIVANDDFTTTVELGHTPKQEGFRNYRVEIQPVGADTVENEAFAGNNQRSLSVAVSDNRTEILIIEGRPRWEFGYLRNLFANRDATVQLQTVLFEPDRFLQEGYVNPIIHASASREAHEIEATVLPKDESEWLKFDVIILGDVATDQFSAEQLGILQKFVGQRGGALIVIAGQRHMPHRYAGTALAEMLPIEFAPDNAVLFKGVEPSFDFRLTQIGKRQEIMKQADTFEASESIWKSIPKMYWRHPLTGTKPAATVVAYASNDKIEKDLQAVENESPESGEARRLRRDTYQRQNVLIAIQKYGLGRVMMLNTDRTWRFRYRVGDTYHHRFWGQVMRWATAEKLQAGTEFVQIGTDRIEYQPDESVQISAKLTDSYFAPLDDKDALIKVYRGEELVISKKLEPDENAPGTFRVDLGKMDGYGQFRIELDSPEAKRIFAGSDDGPVETQITVLAPENNALELIDPTADRAGLLRLTSLSGGTVVEADSRNSVFDYFASGSQRYIEHRSITLWDTWPLLLVMVVLLTVEWVIRKQGGLV